MIVVICLVAMGASYWVLYQHYRNFGVGEKNDAVYRVESLLLDMRLRLRGVRQPSGRVGVLAIDERTIQEFGRWPFSRKYYVKAFENLKKLGVHWVGFDSIFSEPEQTKLREVAAEMEQFGSDQANIPSMEQSLAKIRQYLIVSPGDLEFSEAISEFENIVLGYFFSNEMSTRSAGANVNPFPQMKAMMRSATTTEFPNGKQLNDYNYLLNPPGIVPNLELYTKATSHYGFFSNQADDDAIYRWVSLLANVGGSLMPSLALKTVAEYLDREIYVLFDEFGVENVILLDSKNEESPIEIPVDIKGTGRMLVNHLGPGETFHHFSLADAYHNTFSPSEVESLKGSLLLLGATATGINDIRPNPFDPLIFGVENHAAVIENILTQDFLKRPAKVYEFELVAILVLGLIFCPIMVFGNSKISAISVVALAVSYYFIDQYVWFNQGIWVFMGVPAFELLFMFVGGTLYKYSTEEAEKKKVKGAFQHYLSPEVISQVLSEPEALKLGGQKKELTVFFSDVRDFTSISESLTPERLCELMNDYFTPMTEIILRSGGVLDKYIGDAIMAFWGAPLALKNAPDTACHAAIEMLFSLEKLRSDFDQKGFPRIEIGIGINTGPMSVGNMGSGDRFTYTVMGDSVNLGARLEGLTKQYGVKALVSGNTVSLLDRKYHFCRDLDDIRVKGKSEPVRVFELMKPDFLPQEAHLQEFIGIFEHGRATYRERDFIKAEKAFLDCLQMRPDDPCAQLFLDRIEGFKKQAPEEHWDGVYTYYHK